MHLDTWRISSPQEQLGREKVEDYKFQQIKQAMTRSISFSEG
jgi:hypothetical protein